jgi:hypothetical protein
MKSRDVQELYQAKLLKTKTFSREELGGSEGMENNKDSKYSVWGGVGGKWGRR